MPRFIASLFKANAVFLLSGETSFEINERLAGRKASLRTAQKKLSIKNKIKLVTNEYAIKNSPEVKREIFINVKVPSLSLSFPEKGEEMKAPIP